MAWPPPLPPDSRQNVTTLWNNHPSDHNTIADALSSIVTQVNAVGVPLPVVNGQWVKGAGGAAVWSPIAPSDIGAVAAATVAPATTTVLTSSLLATDTQPAVLLRGDGRITWGPGGTTAPDTDLYRLSAARLSTDGMFTVGNSITCTPNMFLRNNTAHLYFGLSDDANLYRQAVNTLKSDGQVNAVKGVATFVKAGAPVDADFPTPIDGLLVVDTTNNKLWARLGGVWKGTVLT
jgi:hypothetical protein